MRMGARTVPYWQAGAAFLPYGEGYFPSAGLLTWAFQAPGGQGGGVTGGMWGGGLDGSGIGGGAGGGLDGGFDGGGGGGGE